MSSTHTDTGFRHKEHYERRKKEREVENRRLVQRRQELIAERQRLLAERDGNTPTHSNALSRQSNNYNLETKVERAKLRIPEFAERFQTLKDEEDSRKKLLQVPYRGELGAGSYEPWQLEDFYFVREFVKSWLDEVLDFIIHEPSGAARQRIQTIVQQFQRKIEAVEKNQLVSEAVDAACWSIIEEVNEAFSFDIATGCLSLHEQARNVIYEIVVAAVSNQNGFNQRGWTENEEKANLIASAFGQLGKEREKKLGIWAHSQKLQLQGVGIDDLQQSDNSEDTFDGTVLHFHNIVPFDDVPDSELPVEFVKFREEESKYWMGHEPLATSLPLNKRYRGVSCASVSPSHTLVALGMVQGDIAVWDLMLYPPRILRSIKGNTSVVDISWSIDSSQLLTITKYGTVQLWSLADTQTVTFSVKAFEPSEPNSTFKPSTLQNLLTIELQQLFFTKGPFTEARHLIQRPVKAVFYPSMTFLASQPSIVLGLENGNILKLNLDPDSTKTVLGPSVIPHNAVENRVGQSIEAELFKGHEHTIIHISFVENVSSMITVDSKGFVNLWEYSEKYLTGFNWFSPKHKYRLDMTEVVYKPAPGSQEKIEFTDKVKGKGRRVDINREEMIKKRKEVQTQINSLFLGTPWLTEEKGNLVTNVYAPKTVPEHGATFHQISHHENTGLLAQYTTQLYKPVKVPCYRLISCTANPSGTKLVFMLLVPENPPKEARVVFVIVQLPGMTVMKSLIEAPVSLENFKEAEKPDTCSFAITKPLSATGTEYVIANLAGVLCGFSMATGNTVLAETEKGWIGCHMSSQQSHTLPTAGILVTSSPPHLQLILFGKRHNFVSLIHLSDHSTRQQILTTWDCFKHWQYMYSENQQLCHHQQMWTRSHWILLGKSDAHVECYLESLILDLVDQAVQIVNGQFTEENARAFAIDNREIPFTSRVGKFQRSDSIVLSPEKSRMSAPSSLFGSGLQN